MFSYKDNKAYKFKLRSVDSFSSTGCEMPPPPSPSTETTCSSSLKRKKGAEESETMQMEESWSLPDLIYVEETKGFVLGKVMKIDADYVIVKMSTKEETANNETLLDSCRVFPKSQLQAIKSTASLKLPEFMQRAPKRLLDFGHVLTLSAQHTGLHALVYKDNGLALLHYDIIGNKVAKERRINTLSHAFVGHSVTSIRLASIDDPSFNTLTLFDGTSTLYPIVELAGSGCLKEPTWKNLQPMRAFSQAIKVCDNSKRVLLTLFTMRSDTLTTHILRYDLDKVTAALEKSDAEKARKFMNERTSRASSTCTPSTRFTAMSKQPIFCCPSRATSSSPISVSPNSSHNL
jgi:hypothetical protein